MLKRRILSSLLAVPLLAVAACSGSPAPDTPTPTAPTTSPTASEPAEPTTPEESPSQTPTSNPEVDLPDTELGQAARWVLDQLAAESGPTTEEVEARFAPEMIEQVPAKDLVTAFEQLRAGGPYTLTGWDEMAGGAVGRLKSDKGQIDMQISVDGDKIDGLLFTPAEDAPEIGSIDEARKALQERSPGSGFLFADESCSPIEGDNYGSAMPIGSMFKLYVLGALVTGVEKGNLSWDDELTLTEELKSLPSGKLQDEPVGTKLTVAEAAKLMISISDNTATDMLIKHVGREAVEAEVEAMGHESPEMLRPFLTTREAFQMALSDPELRKKWADTSGDPTNPHPETSAEQRAIVDSLPGWDLTFDETLAQDPFWDESLDWFASATDLCHAHKHLQERAKTEAGAPVRDILSENPGVQLPDADFVGFKGGSAPGEIGLSYWVERGGETRVLVMQTYAETLDGVPNAGWLAGLAQQILELQ